MRKVYLIMLLSFFYFQIKAQVFFGEQNVLVSKELSDIRSIYSADIDGDGNTDIVVGSLRRISWHENNGNGVFTSHIINSPSIENTTVQSVQVVDIDNDSDNDIVIACKTYYEGSYESFIIWYENIDGNGTFGDENIITDNLDGPNSIFAIDIDGDNDVDILSASYFDGKITWFENLDGNGNFSVYKIITEDAQEAVRVYSFDVDGDNDNDVVFASDADDKLAWFENTDGNGSFSNENTISFLSDNTRTIISFDIDNDGDDDIITSTIGDNKISWYENTDGNGTFGTQQIISTETNKPYSIILFDIDGDGDKDIVAGSLEGKEIAWYENTDNNGNFSSKQIISTLIPDAILLATDIDGDLKIDLVSAPIGNYSGKGFIVWHKNINNDGTFSEIKTIVGSGNGATSLYSCDIDGDSDNDIVLGSSLGTSWFENIDGIGNFSSQKIISTNIAKTIFSIDVDGDGDNDIISGSLYNDITWSENIDGNGTFDSPKTVSSYSANYIYSCDLDGDNDNDILVTNLGAVFWFENIDGVGNFSTSHSINNNVEGSYGLYASDLDGDNDIDVIITKSNWSSEYIAWYENNGEGSFSENQIITTSINEPKSIYACDIDGDGDNDILSASSGDDKIAWYENTDGNGSFGNQKIISSSVDGASSVYAEDFDGDGDNDVVFASERDDKIYWAENLDGQGNFGNKQTISNEVNGAYFVFAKDINNDEDVDIISVSWEDGKLAWYENSPDVKVEFIKEDAIRIFPNPVKDLLNIKVNTNEVTCPFYIQLNDIMGKLVLKKELKNNLEIDLSNYQKGIYLLRIQMKDKMFTNKIIKN